MQEERKRLRLVAADVCESAGVGRATYTRWEAGSPIPSDKLAILAELGFDIQFVVTGKRKGIDEAKLRDSLEVVFDVLAALKETGDDISAERAAQLVSMIYDRLAKGKSFGENEIELMLKLAS